MESKRKGSEIDVAKNEERECSEYEELRQRRIRENMERMEKLGILALSTKLKHHSPTTTTTKRQKPPQTNDPPLSTRRSSRLTTTNRVNYAEKSQKSVGYVIVPATKKERRGVGDKKGRRYLDDEEICIKDGINPEVYTEEHELLLGDCRMTWVLDVDGYDEDGQRMYDQYEGKHCHQCRQTTLGNHTKCSKCKAVEGQFCGDCLFTRYGENVVETNENLSWICPNCRGICNCSRCRRAKGWEPTGDIYRKVKKLGFKSVAHYLIGTHLKQKIDQNPADGSQALADEELKLNDDASSQSVHNSSEKITVAKEHSGTDEDYDANESDGLSEKESQQYSNGSS